jgi:hypothetical protein
VAEAGWKVLCAHFHARGVRLPLRGYQRHGLDDQVFLCGSESLRTLPGPTCRSVPTAARTVTVCAVRAAGGTMPSHDLLHYFQRVAPRRPATTASDDPHNGLPHTSGFGLALSVCGARRRICLWWNIGRSMVGTTASLLRPGSRTLTRTRMRP